MARLRRLVPPHSASCPAELCLRPSVALPCRARFALRLNRRPPVNAPVVALTYGTPARRRDNSSDDGALPTRAPIILAGLLVDEVAPRGPPALPHHPPAANTLLPSSSTHVVIASLDNVDDDVDMHCMMSMTCIAYKHSDPNVMMCRVDVMMSMMDDIVDDATHVVVMSCHRW